MFGNGNLTRNTSQHQSDSIVAGGDTRYEAPTSTQGTVRLRRAALSPMQYCMCAGVMARRALGMRYCGGNGRSRRTMHQHRCVLARKPCLPSKDPSRQHAVDVQCCHTSMAWLLLASCISPKGGTAAHMLTRIPSPAHTRKHTEAASAAAYPPCPYSPILHCLDPSRVFTAHRLNAVETHARGSGT